MMRLAKLHATGNDFLVTSDDVDAPTAAALCDRHRGIGADGVITLGPGTHDAHASMTLRNADGSLAEMSGNGVRCLAWVAVRAGLDTGTDLVVDTGGGRRIVALERDDEGLVGASVDMGAATFEPSEIPLDAASPFDLEVSYHGASFVGDAVGMGNPHLVLPADDVSEVKVASFGPRFEVDERFPNGTNVEWATILDRTHIDMRVWERGVGETLSCGTGACAVAAVAHRRALIDDDIIVSVLGGELTVHVGDTIRLGGPVRHLFNVEVDPDVLGARRSTEAKTA
jgi:diaminopimelate epimerase